MTLLLSSPWRELCAGGLIGLAASLLLAVNGGVMGISGMLGSLLTPWTPALIWRAVFLSALVVVGIAARILAPATLAASPAGLPLLAIAGLLVGAGTSIGGGCTSGHGVCGTSRLSRRSVVATVTFVLAGMLTVTLQHCVVGGSP